MKHIPRKTILILMTLILALDATVSAGMLKSGDTLDISYGKGETRIINVDGGSAAQYYTALYSSSKDALSAALQVSQKISDEGTVLLKNNGLLPLASDTAVSPLGLGCFVPLYSGTGSSAISTRDSDVISPVEGLRSVFSKVNTTVESAQQKAWEGEKTLDRNQNIVAALPVDGRKDQALYEFSPAVYEDVLPMLEGTVGIVYIVRRAGENEDACMREYDDGTPHALALTRAEKEIIALAKARCRAVAVVVASASPMELAALQDDPGISAILWQGGAGSTGYASIAAILAGQVNPSGRLPFTFAADFTRDPTYPNQDDGSDRFTYANAFTTALTHITVEENTPAPFHEYEEGIYLGYRYYETAWEMGALPDYYSREEGVVYPFGFGLSYTRFIQRFESVSLREDQIILRVRVTNTGDTAGKDTVQLYCTAPYTALDQQYKIEKPAAFLAGFAKTAELAPGESEAIELTVSPENLASYCYTRPNADGTVGCYVAEEGRYVFSLRGDSHTVLDTAEFHLPGTAWFSDALARPSERYAQSPMLPDGSVVLRELQIGAYTAATNQFSRLNAYMSESGISHAVPLTRTDWTHTFPTAPSEEDRAASETVIGWIRSSDATRAAEETDVNAARPISGAENGLVLADLRGVPYDDPMWDMLLDQLTYDDPETYRQVLFEAAYQTGALPCLRKPRSSEKDGPQGLTLADVSGKNWISGVCGYPAAPVMAATWNEELLYELGAMVGQEALITGINGWYAPGLNILRSPFCGRASEYYSEDPLLAGTLGTQAVSGAGNNGLACAAKHFCLMETEAHRGPNTCTWMTEQTLREIYLKPFEMIVKNARKTVRYAVENAKSPYVERIMRAGNFLMTSDSAVGTEWTAACPRLLTNVLRKEWGFNGAVVSDIHMNANSGMIGRMLTAGCDALMSLKDDQSVNFDGYNTAVGQSLIRTAVKDLCFTLVNSSMMQGISSASVIEYGMSPWKKVLLIVNILVFFLLLTGAVLCVIPAGRKKDIN